MGNDISLHVLDVNSDFPSQSLLLFGKAVLLKEDYATLGLGAIKIDFSYEQDLIRIVYEGKKVGKVLAPSRGARVENISAEFNLVSVGEFPTDPKCIASYVSELDFVNDEMKTAGDECSSVYIDEPILIGNAKHLKRTEVVAESIRAYRVLLDRKIKRYNNVTGLRGEVQRLQAIKDLQNYHFDTKRKLLKKVVSGR